MRTQHGDLLVNKVYFKDETYIDTAGVRPLNIRNVSGNYVVTQEDTTNYMIRVDAALNNDAHLILPNDATVDCPVGTTLIVASSGLGRVVIEAQSGAQVKSPQSNIIDRRYGRVVLIKTGPNLWEIDGQLVAQAQFTVLPIEGVATMNIAYMATENPVSLTDTLETEISVGPTYYWIEVKDTNVSVPYTGSWSSGTGNQWCYGDPTGKYFKARIIAHDTTKSINPPTLIQITGSSATYTLGYLATDEWAMFNGNGNSYYTNPRWKANFQIDQFFEYTLEITVADTASDATILGSFTVQMKQPRIGYMPNDFDQPSHTDGLVAKGYRSFSINSDGTVSAKNFDTGNEYGATPAVNDMPGSLIKSVFAPAGNPPPYNIDSGLYNVFFQVDAAAGAPNSFNGTIGAIYNNDGIGQVEFGFDTSYGVDWSQFNVTTLTDNTGVMTPISSGIISLGNYQSLASSLIIINEVIASSFFLSHVTWDVFNPTDTVTSTLAIDNDRIKLTGDYDSYMNVISHIPVYQTDNKFTNLQVFTEYPNFANTIVTAPYGVSLEPHYDWDPKYYADAEWVQYNDNFSTDPRWGIWFSKDYSSMYPDLATMTVSMETTTGTAQTGSFNVKLLAPTFAHMIADFGGYGGYTSSNARTARMFPNGQIVFYDSNGTEIDSICCHTQPLKLPQTVALAPLRYEIYIDAAGAPGGSVQNNIESGIFTFANMIGDGIANRFVTLTQSGSITVYITILDDINNVLTETQLYLTYP